MIADKQSEWERQILMPRLPSETQALVIRISELRDKIEEMQGEPLLSVQAA